MRKPAFIGGRSPPCRFAGCRSSVPARGNTGMAAYNRGDGHAGHPAVSSAGRKRQSESAKPARDDVPQGTRGRAQFGSCLHLVQPRGGARRRQAKLELHEVFADHDQTGNFGSRGDGAGLPGVGLPELRSIRGLSLDVSNIAPTSAGSIKNKNCRGGFYCAGTVCTATASRLDRALECHFLRPHCPGGTEKAAAAYG